MVAFDLGKAHFNYRVAGVALHDGHVLLDRNCRNSYWVLPGGHPDPMEPMAEALRREVNEEIGNDVEVVRLLWVIENFFHKKKDIHELSFYFLMELKPNSPLLKGPGPFYGDEHDQQLIFQWFPLDEDVLMHLPLFPGYLPKALLSVPESPLHVVFNDIEAKPGPQHAPEHVRPSAQRLTIS